MKWSAVLAIGLVVFCAQVGYAQNKLEDKFKQGLKQGLGRFLGVQRDADGTVKIEPPKPQRQRDFQPQAHVVQTADGWKLVLLRYQIPGVVDLNRPPVILCHGFSYSADFYDLESAVSLAQYLARDGFDVWVPNLRGCGMSNKWAAVVEGGAQALVGKFAAKQFGNIPPEGYVSLNPKFASWNFDDHVNYDVTAILFLVTQMTQKPQVTWVGHSMGGNIVLAYLSRYGQDPKLSRLVTVGSQMTMPNGQLVLNFLYEMLKVRQFELTGQKPQKEEVLKSVHNIFFNEANTSPNVMQALETWANDMPSVGLLRQYTDLALTKEFYNVEKTFPYRSGLRNISCPCLIVGGAYDQVAPPDVQRYLFDHIGSQERQLLILGQQNGFSVNYGHNDSLVGLAAPNEVYPKIAAFLKGVKP